MATDKEIRKWRRQYRWDTTVVILQLLIAIPIACIVWLLTLRD